MSQQNLLIYSRLDETDKIIKAFKEDDTEKLNKYYTDWKKSFLKNKWDIIARKGLEEDVHSIYNDTFIILYQKIKNGEFEKRDAKVTTYLNAIGYYKFVDLLKEEQKNRMFQSLNNLDSLDSVSQSLVFCEQEIVNQYVLSIPYPCNFILEAFFLKDIPMKDVAAEIGYTTKGAYNRKNNCLEQAYKDLKHIFVDNL